MLSLKMQVGFWRSTTFIVLAAMISFVVGGALKPNPPAPMTQADMKVAITEALKPYQDELYSLEYKQGQDHEDIAIYVKPLKRP